MSDEKGMTEFDVFLIDLKNGNTIEQPATLEEIIGRSPKQVTAKDVLEQHRRDIDRPRERDPFAVDEAVAQLRIAREIATPTQPGQTFTPSGAPFGKVETPTPQHDELMRALELEVEGDPELPEIRGSVVSVPDATPAARFPDHGRAGQRSFLDGSVGEVLTKVADRMSGDAKQFALDLAKQAEEMEVTL